MRIYNESMKGMALPLALVFVLILVLFAFTVLLLAGGYYSSTRSLFENENSRRACEAVATELVHKHNTGKDPRYFHDPQNWSGTKLLPFQWNGYETHAVFDAAWNTQGSNRLRLSVNKRRFKAEQQFEIRQRRLENFAFFSDSSQQLNTASLFDGPVVANLKLELLKPVVRFREIVQSDVLPLENASFRRNSLAKWSYPTVQDLIEPESLEQIAITQGVRVASKDPAFWNGQCYDIDLDQLELRETSGVWETSYQGVPHAVSTNLYFYFDDQICIRQSETWSGYLPPTNQRASLYFASPSQILVRSGLHTIESEDALHPLCLLSASTIQVEPQLRAAVLESVLISAGGVIEGEEQVSLKVRMGEGLLSEEQKNKWIDQITTSAFLLEEEKKDSLIASLQQNEKILWFRGTVAVVGKLLVEDDVSQVHFEASTEAYPLLPSLPIVYIVEGSRIWQ